jgi:nucleotide-binding universal stress UspA family protein
MQSRKSRLDGLAEELRRKGVSVATHLFCGHPAREITREVLRNDYDLVISSADVVAKRTKSPAFGVTAIRLMRVCPCRVCVTGFAEDVCCSKILAAVDPQANEATHCELNKLVLDTSVSLARQQGGQVTVIATWSAFAQSVLHVKLTDEEVEAYVESSRVNATQRLESLLQPFREDIAAERVHLVQGDANDVIAEFAQESDADMLVVGAVPRRGLGGLLVGNTAEDVIRKVRCSVLVVKPDSLRLWES